ncbi:MAG: hypothetical protein DCC58_11535 [Chloroflexi bacterium]|nr:MAG: hypothetical protein DCC58_11535 [Chloroflexota bacterium]
MVVIRSFPSAIYVDTSVVVAAILEDALHHTGARTFCNQLIENRSRVCFSQLLRLELAQAIRVYGTVSAALPVTVRRRYRLARWDRDHEVRARWYHDGVTAFEALLADLSRVYEIPIRVEDWRSSIALMSRYHLRSYDAFHAATALGLGVFNFATLDSDFTRVSELNIHLLRDVSPLPEQS